MLVGTPITVQLEPIMPLFCKIRLPDQKNQSDQISLPRFVANP